MLTLIPLRDSTLNGGSEGWRLVGSRLIGRLGQALTNAITVAEPWQTKGLAERDNYVRVYVWSLTPSIND